MMTGITPEKNVRNKFDTTFADIIKFSTILANLAVLGTLLLLVYELKDNTKATLALNRQSLSARVENLLIAQADDINFASVHNRAKRGLTLTPEERVQYILYFSAALRLTEEAFLQYQDGLLSCDYWIARSNNLIYRMRAPVLREVWNTWRKIKMFTPEFSSWLDGALQQKYGIMPNALAATQLQCDSSEE